MHSIAFEWNAFPGPLNALRSLTALGLALLWLPACADSAGAVTRAAASGPGNGLALTNLRLPATRLVGEGDFVVFNVPEASQGGRDLNRDGDSEDQVMFVYDATAGRVMNSRLAAAPPPSGFSFGAPGARVGSDFVVLPAHEASQGDTDLNGDGDADDAVLFIFHLRTAELECIEYALLYAANLGLAVGESTVSFLVPESAQGGQDVNGDGDLYDAFLHILDVETSLVRPIAGEANWQILAAGHRVAYTVHEGATTGDLNGDGDESDVAVLHTLDSRSGLLTNTGVAVGSVIGHGSGAWVVSVNEEDQGADFNGDADLLDLVYASYDPSTADLRSHGVGTRATHLREASVHGPLATANVEEVAMGQDLNGDGDQLDIVPFVLDPATGQSVNSHLSGSEAVLLDNWLAVLVDERHQGNSDLDGDGLLNSRVLHVFDPATGATINLAIDAFFLREAGRYLLFNRSEASADTDWNGDGDKADYFQHWWDSASGSIHRMRRSSDGGVMDLLDGTALISVGEESESEDLNGDGDTLDRLVFALDLASGRVLSTGLGVAEALLTTNRSALIAVPEDVGGEDLNGDGDTGDTVLFHADLFR